MSTGSGLAAVGAAADLLADGSVARRSWTGSGDEAVASTAVAVGAGAALRGGAPSGLKRPHRRKNDEGDTAASFAVC